MATTHTPTTLAEQLGTSPKTVRKFLRSEAGMDSKVGKGKRWEITGKEAAQLKRRFPKWQAEQEAERKARQEKRDAETVEENTETVEAETVDTPTDEVPEEPTDEELAEIDDEN